MTDTAADGPPEPDRSKPTIITPPSIRTINQMGVFYLVASTLFFYLLIITWPVLTEDGKAFKEFHVLGYKFTWLPDKQMLFTVMVAGALGSLTHTMTSFADYVGNREISTNWLWFFALRIPIGITLAVLFYLIVRGGLLLPTLPGAQGAQPPDSLHLNPYGIAAFGALAGMFSRQATDKLAAVFDAVFSMKKPVERDNGLGSNQAILLKVLPPKLTKGKREDLIVTGSGFQTGTKATVNGKDRKFVMTSATEGKVILLDDDVKDTAKLAIAVTNPNKDAFTATVDVVAHDTPLGSVVPPKLVKGTAEPLTVTGSGFQTGTKATVNGKDRDFRMTSATEGKIILLEDDVRDATTLAIVVTNPNKDAFTAAVDVA